MSEREHLVKMANQIAANFRYHDDGVERIADHLKRFWAPSMKRQLLELAASGNAGLDERVREAARRLEA
jgi:formate dehydrogenase subunit delta